MEIYNGSFSSIKDVCDSFCIADSDLDGVEILYANYDTPPYEGYAWVIFRKDDHLYEVNGSHCSCAGLEGQWEPSLSSVKAILMRPNLNETVKEMLQNLNI